MCRIDAKLFINVFEHVAEMGVLITDKNGVIVHVNDAITKLTGYSKSELIGKNPSVLKSGKHDEFFYQNMWCTIKEGKIFNTDIWNKDKNGVIYKENLTIIPAEDDDGNIEMFIAIIFAKMVSHVTEEELIMAERFSNAVFNDAGVGIALFDLECRYKLFNPMMERLTGKKASDVLGKEASMVFPELKNLGFEKAIDKVIQGEVITSSEVQYELRETNKKGTVIASFSPFYDKDNKIDGVLCIIKDVSHLTLVNELQSLLSEFVSEQNVIADKLKKITENPSKSQ